MTPESLLDDNDLAALCKVQPSTVKRWRRKRTGPPVVWLNAISPRYRRSDVEAWLESRAA